MKVDIFKTDNKYNIIYADPPWRYKDKNCNGACATHYAIMSLKEIHSLPIEAICEKDCVLFLWATYPMLNEALTTIKSWGFTYKTIAFQWIKQNKSGKGYFFGLGRWTRGNTECCLIAIKGKPKRVSNSVSQLIIEPLTKHSEKPAIVRKKIKELMGDLPSIELFARKEADGWDAWGDEI